jgi:hypothetical protein
MKRTENLALRVSEPVKKSLAHIAKDEDRRGLSELLLEAILMLLADRGLSLPPECPEYRVLEAADGSVNAHLAELMAAAIPVARRKSQGWAKEYAVARFGKLWEKIQRLDDPKLYNDAYELFSDPKRTPREKLRAMEFRLENLLRIRKDS